MSKKLFLVLLIVSIFFILSAVEGFAAVPQKMNFQGRLMKITGGGTPTPETGGKSVKFSIENLAGTTTYWFNTNNVSCDSQGQFSTVLDISTGQVPEHPLDFSIPLYLHVEYPVGTPLLPPQPLETAPYAFYAVTAETVVGSAAAGGWVDAGAVVKLATITDKVGIGTTEPGASLTVAGGRIQATGSTNPTSGAGLELGYDGTYGIIVPYSRDAAAYKALRYNALDHEFLISGVQKVTIDTAGNVGIGTTSPGASLEVAGNISVESGKSYFGGNVGIGTANPTEKLTIKNGRQTINLATGTNNSDYNLNIGANDTGVNFENGSASRGFNFKNVNGNLVNISSTGNVGIGTTNPTNARLVIDSTGVNIDSISLIPYLVGNHSWRIGPGSGTLGAGFGFHDDSDGATRMTIKTNGEIMTPGVYETSLISGTPRDVYVDQNGKLGYWSSSIRYKENIRPIDAYSAKVLALNPIVFNFKADKDKKIQFGLIAEEVNNILPEIVIYDKEGRPETVQYEQLIPLLLKTAQEQQKRINQLQNQNDELKSRIEALEKTLK
jgi:hypothetical protein